VIASATLALSPFWRDEAEFLLRATDGLRLCGDGSHEELPWGQALVRVDQLGPRDMGRVRIFVAATGLVRGSLSGFDDHELLAMLRAAIRRGDLVVVRVGHGGAKAGSDATTEERHLVRAIEVAARGRLSLAGRRYHLVAGLDLGRVPDRDRYEVESRADAVRVLDGLAGQPGTSPELSALLGKATQKLTADWWPPFSPDGLVLLRMIAARQTSSLPIQETALTPSQMKALLKSKEWIEVEVVESDGEPYQGAYRIELPDKSTVKGNFDKAGTWEERDIDPGTCKLTLVEFAGVVVLDQKILHRLLAAGDADASRQRKARLGQLREDLALGVAILRGDEGKARTSNRIGKRVDEAAALIARLPD
jgi:hypothetical protein